MSQMKSNEAELKQILGELSGFSSLCWTPKPTGEFDSTQAVTAVQVAYEKIVAFTEEKDRLLGEANKDRELLIFERDECHKNCESLRKENEFIHTEVYKSAVAEGIHDKINDQDKEISRLKELQGKLVSALNLAKDGFMLIRGRVHETGYNWDMAGESIKLIDEALSLAKGESNV